MRTAIRTSDSKRSKEHCGRRIVAVVTLVCLAPATLSSATAWADPLEPSPDSYGAAPLADVARQAAIAVELERAEHAGLDPGSRLDSSKRVDSDVQRRVGDLDSLSSSIDAPLAPPPLETQSLPTGAEKSGVTSQAISVPQGSGKIDGMGESFSTQLSTGTVTFTVPFSLPAARGGAQPSLSLVYSSGAGAGIAGIGWDVGVPFIARQTDRGIPRYQDGPGFSNNQDRFVFNGGQELVPICVVGPQRECTGALPGEVMPAWSAGSTYFRARVEGTFQRFFWSANRLTWRVQDKSGVTMELGVALDGSNDTTALDRNPDEPAEIYRWHLVRQYDAYGDANPSSPTALPAPVNQVVYRYFQAGGRAYLSDIFDTSPVSDPATKDVSKFAHHTRLTYENRSDPTFSYRSGWRIDQLKRLKRVDVTSKAFNEGVNAARRMVRRYHLSYEQGQHASLLASVEIEGRCASSDQSNPNAVVTETSAPTENGLDLPATTGCPKLPPMTFSYSHSASRTTTGKPGSFALTGYEPFDERLRQLATSPRHSLDEELSDLFDIDGNALPDVLVTAPGTYGSGHGVFFNADGGIADSFGVAQQMGVQGVNGADAGTLKLSNLNVVALDLDGDATADLLHMPALKTYSIYTPQLLGQKWTWVGRAVATASGQNAKIDFGKDTLDKRVVDVNFDGLVDVVVSTGLQFQTFFSLGRYPDGAGQFGSAVQTDIDSSEISNDPVSMCVPWAGTPVRLSDADTQLADMNGDGIQDIVRIRRGDIRYWPGRGNGMWGTGRRDDCPANTFSDERYLTMTESPIFSDIQGTTLRVDDVNGDGLDDLLQVRFNAVDVWLNVDGLGWTERHIIKSTPESPSFANRVRLIDINGSGTRDILWGNSSGYQYIDLQGGMPSHLLVRVENGLGKSTDIEYATSTAEMLAADKFGGKCDSVDRPWSSPWCSKMPIVAHVVKRLTESDNLVVAGKPACTYVTEYQYRDPVYDGGQREFRGFRRARAKRVGDDNSPTDFTETTFLLGECKDDVTEDDFDACEDWRDNPRESLKGLPVVTEKYDERGVYLSTDAMTYRLRRLYVGLDGREVRHAFVSANRNVLYDTAQGRAPGGSGLAVPCIADDPGCFVSVELERDFFNPVPNPLAVPPTLRPVDRARLPVRQPSARAEISSSSVIDFFGNQVLASANGCVAGEACPGSLPEDVGFGIVPDEAIRTHSVPIQPQDDRTGWLWRTQDSFVRGSVHTGIRNSTSTSFTPEGQPFETVAGLEGVLPLDRFHATLGTTPGVTVAPPPPSASAEIPHPVTIAIRTYSNLGQLVEEAGPSGRCRNIGYDTTYGALPVSETIFTGGGCGAGPLLTKASAYDRGLGVVTVVVDMQLEASYADYDGFGRTAELRRPLPSGTFEADPKPPNPTLKTQYFLPSPSNPVKYSIVRTQTQDGADPSDAAEYLQSLAYIDGLGRTLVRLAEAENEGTFIAQDFQEYDNKFAVRRKYLAFFYVGDEFSFPIGAVPNAPYGRQRYDAFGRQLQTYDLDGTVTLQSRYHALSTDLFDAADLEPGPHYGTPASTRNDGHGRTIATTERVRVNGALEWRQVRTQFLPTGEPEVIRRFGPGNVVRWMRYDSLGRMVLNVEPNTTENFNGDPTTDPMPGPGKLKAWRYAYNDAGDLVGTSDARGCGQNFFYDGAGRLIGEDYSPCEVHHAPYTLPALNAFSVPTGEGVEVFYVYDAIPTNVPVSFRPPGYSPNGAFLKGRLAAVFDRAATTWTTYDGRGRVTRTDRRIFRTDADLNAPFASRYATRWHTQDAAYDAADREVAATTGSTVMGLQGQPLTAFAFDTARNKSVVTTAYSRRGTLSSVGGSYGGLSQGIERAADGLPTRIEYGDAASTATEFSYDNRRRLRNVQTYRAPPAIWTPPSYLPAPDPGSTTSFQLLLQDQDFTYDAVGNPIEIRDWRQHDEWPAGAKPVSRQVQYDDLNRVSRVDYEYASGHDSWTSPFDPELTGSTDPRRGSPSPHVSFVQRTNWESFEYDWLGNTTRTDDDAHGFYDRSLGTISNDVAKPYQVQSATNAAIGGTHPGAVATLYDAAGNLTRMNVVREGACLGSADCSQRFDYRWDEVGRLTRARRWDVVGSTLTTPGAALPSEAEVDADLTYFFDAGDQRVIKRATAASASVHTLYVFDSLEVRGAALVVASATVGDYELNADTEVPYLLAEGARLARVVFEPNGEGEPRIDPSSGLHVFLELDDRLGSMSIVLDKGTGELVERGTYRTFGGVESDYRPERWNGFREDYRFTGKEEDIEVGLQYFGKRFYAAQIGRWISADPLPIHDPGSGDLNVYAYVAGRALIAIDAVGLDDETVDGGTQQQSEGQAVAQSGGMKEHEFAGKVGDVDFPLQVTEKGLETALGHVKRGDVSIADDWKVTHRYFTNTPTPNGVVATPVNRLVGGLKEFGSFLKGFGYGISAWQGGYWGAALADAQQRGDLRQQQLASGKLFVVGIGLTPLFFVGPLVDSQVEANDLEWDRDAFERTVRKFNTPFQRYQPKPEADADPEPVDDGEPTWLQRPAPRLPRLRPLSPSQLRVIFQKRDTKARERPSAAQWRKALGGGRKQ